MSQAPRLKTVAIPAILLLLAYVGYQFYQRQQAKDDLRQETLENAVSTVSIVHAKPVDPKQSVTLPGTIQAWFEAPIYAQVSGYVKMWYKDYGALVKKGDVLAEINTPTLDAQFEQAKADMESQRAHYNLAVLTAKRYQAMRDSHAVSEQSINVQEANARAEQAQLSAAQQNINNFAAKIKFKTIVAPYDGVVTDRNINVGDYVNKEGFISKEGYISDKKGDINLFSVADINRMRLFISVPGTFAYFLKPGLTADVTVPQFTDRHFTAEFLTVAKGFDPNTRTVVAEFTIDNQDNALWPGSYATVTLTSLIDDRVLTIPSSSMVFDDHATQVAVVTPDQRVHFKPIKVSKLLDATVEVSDGVTVNDQIVDNPSAALLEGDKVRVVKPAPGYRSTAQVNAADQKRPFAD